MRIDVVIPNFNGSSLIKNNLPKVIEAHRDYEGKIILVDDGSSAQDKESLREIVSETNLKKIILLEHAHNQGFASAINTGVRNATAEYVVLLNSDVVPYKDYLESLVKRMGTSDSIFAIGCLDESYENEKIVKRGRGLGKWQKGMLIHSRGEIDSTDTFWVSGGSCILRRGIFNTIGGMDPIYNPFYWEDIDLSYRAQKAGYKIEFDNNSVVKHFHDLGAIKTGFSKSQITSRSYRNQFIFIWKNITSSKLLTSHIINLPINIYGALRRRDKPFFEGFFLAVLKLPAIIKKRKLQERHNKVSDLVLIKEIS